MPAYQRTAPYQIEPEDFWRNSPVPKAGLSKSDLAWNAKRKAEIIAEHEARGCTCHSCIKRKTLTRKDAA